MQPIFVLRGICATSITEAEAHDVAMPDGEFELSEQCAGATAFDIAEAVACELSLRVEDDQVGRIKEAANVVDADGGEALGFFQLGERGAAPADQDRFVAMEIAESFERAW